MAKKGEKYLLEADEFIINLHLMGYPNCKKHEFFFSDFANLKYKNLAKEDLLTYFVLLRNCNDIELKDPIDEKSLLWELVAKRTFKEVRRFFKQNPPQETEKIFNGTDFRIIISKDTQKALKKSHEEYLDAFVDDALTKWRKNYLPFDDQKDLLIEKIKTHIEKYGRELTFHDLDIPEDCNYFYIMFALEKMKYLKIKHIWSASSETDNFNYKILFLANDKKFPIEKKEKPICEIFEGFGYIKFGKNSQRIKISKIDSQPFRLLNLLIKPFGLARSIESAFEVIQTEHSKKTVSRSGEYLAMGEKINALVTVKKELQKIKGFTKILKINIDKERKHIWLSYKK